MSNAAPLCAHIKTDGVRCGSPAVKGSPLCFHHSATKTAMGKVAPLGEVAYGEFKPIPFVFPEDRAAMQINYFLLLQAMSEQRVERRAADLMLRMLRAMDRNLGKSGSLVPSSEEMAGDEAASDQTVRGGAASSKTAGDEMFTYANQVISAANAEAPRYTDYREVNALHPEGQRILNMYCERPLER